MSQWVAEATDNESIIEEVFADNAVRVEARDLIDDWVEELTQRHTRLELFEEGQRRGIPITPVNTIEALVEDPHLQAADFWQTTSLQDGTEVKIPGAPFRSSSAWWSMAPAPRLGQHTDQYLS